MGTTWEEIEARAMTYIKDDLSLEQDMKTRLPVFYNRMRAYMVEAIPLFNRPPEMLERLSQYTEPDFESVSYMTVDGEAQAVDTQIVGGSVACAGIIGEDKFGDPVYTPIPCSYDPESGVVTLIGTYEAGSYAEIDIYTSGSFDVDLNDQEKGILAFAVYNRYEHRFDNDVLERTAKIRDSAFTTISEASQTQANTQRMKAADNELFDRLRAYQQNVEYLRVLNRKP